MELALVWRWGNGETRLQAILNFMNEQVYRDFEQTDKYFWLQEKLGLSESYFWNTYLQTLDEYITEKDNEYIVDRELRQADVFYIY